MPLTEECGPHCGITSTREGHCNCTTLCHAGRAPGGVTDALVPSLIPGRLPMCARWYERCGERRPWLPGKAGRT